MKTNTLSRRRVRRIINCFASGLTAIDTSHKLKLHRNTINKYYRLTRDAICNHQEELMNDVMLNNDVKPEDYIAWHKNHGLTLQYNPSEEDARLFGTVVNTGRVFVQKATKNAAKGEAITAKILEQTQPSQNNGLTARSLGNEEIDETDILLSEEVRRFYVYAKEKLTKFYGVKPQYTYLYLKELEFRFNNQDKNLSAHIWKIVSQYERKLNREKASARKERAKTT